jgi:hypothetical protein
MMEIFAQTTSPLFTTFIQDIIQAVFLVAGAAIASGFVTAAITQLLKWEAIKIPAEKYPVPVAVVLSVLTSGAAVYLTGLVDLVGWTSYVVMAVATLFVSTQTYQVVKNAVDQIKNPEISASTAPGNPEPNPLPPPTDGDQDGILNARGQRPLGPNSRNKL